MTHFTKFQNILESCAQAIKKREKEKSLQSLSILNSFKFDEEWLTCQDKVQVLSEELKRLIETAIIPEFSEREHFIYEVVDFQGYPEKTELVFLLLKIIFKNVAQSCTKSAFSDLLNQILPDLLILISSNSQPSLWSSKTIVEQAFAITQTVKQVFSCEDENLHGILFNKDADHGCSIFNKYFQKVRLRLSKNNWMKNPNIQKSFMWILKQVKFPYLSDCIDSVLPPALNFTDDFEVVNKFTGVECLNHIIDNVSKEELRWHGRADVIFDVLEKTLYNHDPQLIELVHLTILSLLPVYGNLPNDIEKHHKIFQLILRDVEFENKILVRRSMTANLPLFVGILGITVIKHSKKLLNIFESYLEVYDGPEETSRLNILKTLQQFLIVAWPRVHQYTMFLCKIIFKLINDISTDKTTTSISIKSELIAESEKCLILLKICDKENFKNFFDTVKSMEISDFIKGIISHIENHESADCLPENVEEIKKMLQT